MGTTGLIFGAIVVAWLAYLVPMYLRRDSAHQRPEADPASRFSSVQILQRGSAQAVDQDLEPIGNVSISTPLTRRAAIAEIRATERRLAGRRRNVVSALLVAVAAMMVLVVAGVTAWWSALIPAGLLGAFLAVARVSVRAMHAGFDERIREIEAAEDEDTVIVPLATIDQADKLRPQPEASATSVELGAPVGRPGSLWDPLPVTRPTYVSAPTLGRTVRTIDLSAPERVGDNKPVVADAPEATAAPVHDWAVVDRSSELGTKRAVGE